jgi:hypothetical protein
MFKNAPKYQTLSVDKYEIILIAECPGTAKYHTTKSTRLGPSNDTVRVSILDTGYAYGIEAFDCLEVSET